VSSVVCTCFTGTERYFECRDNETIQVSESVLQFVDCSCEILIKVVLFAVQLIYCMTFLRYSFNCLFSFSAVYFAVILLHTELNDVSMRLFHSLFERFKSSDVNGSYEVTSKSILRRNIYGSICTFKSFRSALTFPGIFDRQ